VARVCPAAHAATSAADKNIEKARMPVAGVTKHPEYGKSPALGSIDSRAMRRFCYGHCVRSDTPYRG
jgi:hypothetical protein